MSQSALVDAHFPTPARADVGVKSKAASLASQVSSVRAGSESLRQQSLRNGSLMTTSMADSVRLGNDAALSSSYGKLALTSSSAASLRLPVSPVVAPQRTLKPIGSIGATYEATLADRIDPSLDAETAKYRGMYQKLVLEQVKLKKWDSVSAVLDSMANAQGMAPPLALLLSVLDACKRAKSSRDTNLGPGEVAVKVVAIAAWCGGVRTIDLYITALQVLAQSGGKWEWAVFTVKSMQEAGFKPTDAVYELVVAVCKGSVTAKDRVAAYDGLQSVGLPAYVCFNATEVGK